MADANTAHRNQVFAQVDVILTLLDAGKFDEAHRKAHGELLALSAQEGDSIDQIKAYQVKTSEGFFAASQSLFFSNLWHFFLAFAVGGGLSILIGLVTRHHILARLQDVRTVMRSVAAGDLVGKLPSISRDELGSLLVDVVVMRNSLHELMASIRQNSTALNQASADLALEASRSAETAVQQANSATGMAAAVEQLSVSIDMVDDRASQANSATQEG